MENEVVRTNSSSYGQPGVLRVLLSKEETMRFYNEIAQLYDKLVEHNKQPMPTGNRNLRGSRDPKILYRDKSV